MRANGRRLALLLASTMVVELVASPCFAQSDPTDPWEPMNRRLFAFQEFLDRSFFGPLARAFSAAPSPIRKGLRNFSRNLQEPIIFVNDVLQARPKQAATTLGRVAINTTVGIAGVMDVASKNGLQHHDNDFGTTMGRWGAVPGPYLFLPLIGPSTFRDALGSAADIPLNPLTYTRYPGKTAIGAFATAVGGLDTRLDAQADLDTLRATSTDMYASIRSFYLQNREAEITGKTVTIESLPEIESEPEAPETETPAPEATAPANGATEAPPPPASPAPTPETAPEPENLPSLDGAPAQGSAPAPSPPTP